ncbi:MAG: N-acetylmuramoyl-L-alanine amidase [Ruminococcus sp.]|nr:N-acetylmuramoyl-L-alanine amidase [Ruminococcus sp.]
MVYTNSSLVSLKKLSPNHSGQRNHSIDTISIHCMAGNMSIESCGNLFASSSTEASSNYGIGSDGRIALYVEEKNRSWCTSSASNDNRAVTIEVADDGSSEHRVTDAAMKSLIKLCADICKRNGIKKLLWKADKSLIGQVDKQNMTVHRWFANKSCPGDYLYNKHSYIATEVNKLINLNGGEEMIKYGQTNDAIWSYKQHLRTLKAMGVISQTVDNNGGFGDGTLKATKEVQKAAGITVDGIVGPNTIKAVYALETKAYNSLSTKVANAKKALA